MENVQTYDRILTLYIVLTVAALAIVVAVLFLCFRLLKRAQNRDTSRKHYVLSTLKVLVCLAIIASVVWTAYSILPFADDRFNHAYKTYTGEFAIAYSASDSIEYVTITYGRQGVQLVKAITVKGPTGRGVYYGTLVYAAHAGIVLEFTEWHPLAVDGVDLLLQE